MNWSRSVRAALLTRLFAALAHRVANVAADADARWRVRKDAALGVQAADTRTRIAALVVDARPIARALVVADALGPAAAVRIAKVVGDAGARAGTVLLLADGVRAAWRRIARLWRTLGGNVHCARRTRGDGRMVQLSNRVSGETRVVRTKWIAENLPYTDRYRICGVEGLVGRGLRT